MYHFEKKWKFSSQTGPVKIFGGPTRMFLRAPLWVSTGLAGVSKQARGASLYHSRQCSVALKPRLDCLDLQSKLREKY